MSDNQLQSIIGRLEAAGFDRVQVELSDTEKQEFNIHHGEIKLLRTGLDKTLHITGIRQQRQASLSLNNLSDEAVALALDELGRMADAAQPDTAHDIAPQQPAEFFQQGPLTPDQELMFMRIDEFNRHVAVNHPLIILEEATLDFTLQHSRLINTNGVDFSAQQGVYDFTAMFTAKQGRETSSFNYSGYTSRELDKPLWEKGHLEPLLTQSAEQLRPRQIPEKFSGPVIITPHAFEDFTDFLSREISNRPLIAGTSVYRDQLNQPVTASNLTIHCRPRSEEIANGYFTTDDGVKAEDFTLIEGGVLRSFLLDIYGANKTGLPRALNQGGCMVIEPGEHSLQEMISQIDRGLLLCRFSGGSPNDKGDFSGVAKNSYYIDKGKVAFPVSETMISGNMIRLFHEIDAISRERVDFGSQITPWVRVGGVTIS